MVIYITSVEEVPISTPQLGDMWQDSINYIDGKIYYFGHDGMVKIVSINGVITGTTSMRMVQQLLVPFRLMDNNFTSIKIMVNK